MNCQLKFELDRGFNLFIVREIKKCPLDNDQVVSFSKQFIICFLPFYSINLLLFGKEIVLENCQ